MATKPEIERLAVVETKIDTVITDVKDIKDAIQALDKKFAAKWVQTIVAGLVAAILLAFIGVVIAFFIRVPGNSTTTTPSTSQTTTTTTPTGSTSTTKTSGTTRSPSASATSNATSTPATPSATDTQNSNGGIDVTLPKVTN